MNNVDFAELLNWTIAFLEVVIVLSAGLHTWVEATVKPFLRGIEFYQELPKGLKVAVVQIAGFAFALFTVQEKQINLLADFPMDIFGTNENTWFTWFINAAIITGGAWVEHPVWERIIAGAKVLRDVIYPPQQSIPKTLS